MSRMLSGIALACALAHAGCLQSTHKISRGELNRLAQTPPEQRGQAVRVLQELAGEQPPAATPVDDDTNVSVYVGVNINGGGGGGRARGPVAPTGGGSGGGHGAGKLGGGLANAKADEAWVLFIVAAAVGVSLAFTEGARYDGWVGLHPMHPVHLYGPGGYMVMPLAHIDPETAQWAERAVVRPSEGPWRSLGRAPLDRSGWTFSVLAGAATMVSDDGSDGVGTSGRVQLGYFPSHMVGLQGEWVFGFRDNAVAETLFDHRWGLELTIAPLDAGPFHAGVYGGVALAQRLEDTNLGTHDDRDTALSGGALLQLELTTRLALTGHLGISRAYGDLGREAHFGLSIY